jgi:hypothetical protein
MKTQRINYLKDNRVIKTILVPLGKEHVKDAMRIMDKAEENLDFTTTEFIMTERDDRTFMDLVLNLA